MLELVLLLLASLFLVGLFLFWFLVQRGADFDLPPAEVAHLVELVPLSGVSYRRAERLFDPSDYLFLAGHPLLRKAAQQLERDRRQAAFLWLNLVREDFDKLQRFRNTLLACGASTDARTEWALFLNLRSFRMTHWAVSAWIHVFGLYALPRAHRTLLVSVRQVATILAAVLTRLSPEQLVQVKKYWAAHELAASTSA